MVGIEHIRVGKIEITLWENQSSNGTTYWTATMQKNFKNKNGAWAKTYSLGYYDLRDAILALEHTYAKLKERNKTNYVSVEKR